MGIFQHPHLTRGIVKTPKGAFVISRGLVEMPSEIGESLGWREIDSDDESNIEMARVRTSHGNAARPSERHSRESA
jgi:hypothetical protein